MYVIPPGAQMAIEQGVLRLSPLEGNERRPHLPIDFFLRSLAADRGRQAIGVILSGTASDGTAGLTAIRAHGGITFVQDPRSARFGQMPQSAIDAGVVDFCLPLPALGGELARMARHPYLARSEPVPPTAAGSASLAEVVALVRSATGVDFGEHRPTTFRRRMARRMAVRKANDLGAYLAVLRKEPGRGPRPPRRPPHQGHVLLPGRAELRGAEERRLPRDPGEEGPGRAGPRLGRGLRHRRGGLLARHLARRAPRRRAARSTPS